MKRFWSPIAICALAVAAAAQPLPEPPDGPEGRGRPGAPPEYVEERVMIESCDSACPPARMGRERKMLEAVRISRMTEALDLSEDQIARFFPRLRKMEENRRSLDRQRDELIDELEKALAGPLKDAELKARLDQLDKLEQQKLRRTLADHAELDALLSVPQRAKLRVFNQRFDDEVRLMVRTIRERRLKLPRP
ncbi:MAG: hypothetical protein MUF78_08745 [Candidatus Edwardsbacteria bacterium]|jgi:hypothetical protein|nr:hypothetical protein [Candidatus Edwardsbacteria bacterium]